MGNAALSNRRTVTQDRENGQIRTTGGNLRHQDIGKAARINGRMVRIDQIQHQPASIVVDVSTVSGRDSMAISPQQQVIIFAA